MFGKAFQILLVHNFNVGQIKTTHTAGLQQVFLMFIIIFQLWEDILGCKGWSKHIFLTVHCIAYVVFSEETEELQHTCKDKQVRETNY